MLHAANLAEASAALRRDGRKTLLLANVRDRESSVDPACARTHRCGSARTSV